MARTTKNNHYIPQWHQKGFMSERDNQLCHLARKEIPLPNGKSKVTQNVKWYTAAQQFYEAHLYSTFLGNLANDEIEKKLFGPIDDNGSKAVRAFLTDSQEKWHQNFKAFFTYLDAQKLRTPKGLDWIRSKYPELDQLQLMIEMQSLRTMHFTLWAEGVRELVSAENSDIKFIVSDHPVTVYNYACPPDSELCKYPNDPDIALKGSQTIFPLDKNRCLILSNIEYALNPENTNPLEQRTNATRMRRSMVNTIEFINNRILTEDDVNKINYIIKSRAKATVAAGKEEWLFPENDVDCNWEELRHVLLPQPNMLYRYSGEIYARFEDGTIHYQDMLGRTTPPAKYLNKDINETRLGRNDPCGCGSAMKYKNCCRDIPLDLRTTWSVMSIRERNIAFCNCIRDVLGLNRDKTWLDVRRELSKEHITEIYGFYSTLWPRETDIYALLPKPDGKFRGLYTGPIDARTISANALPMASLFDDFLIETPIINPNNINPEFSPLESPSRYKYQALKDFMFMLQMEPFIRLGLINLIPDPSEFDMPLMRGMMEMAKERSLKQQILTNQDQHLLTSISIEDLLNSTAIMPREARIQLLIHEFGLDEEEATNTIDELESQAEISPLMLLQKTGYKDSGQFLQFRMAPNYEMSLLIAQATGSVLVTDSSSRWQELMSAQHRVHGIASSPWSEVFDTYKFFPIDERFLETFQKSQSYFANARNYLKAADKMVISNNRNVYQRSQLAEQISNFMQLLKQTSEPLRLESLKIASPEGGFYDVNVQRLLALSSCLKYEHQVRSVYGIALHY